MFRVPCFGSLNYEVNAGESTPEKRLESDSKSNYCYYNISQNKVKLKI